MTNQREGKCAECGEYGFVAYDGDYFGWLCDSCVRRFNEQTNAAKAQEEKGERQ